MAKSEGAGTARPIVRPPIRAAVVAFCLLPLTASAQTVAVTSEISGATIQDAACASQRRFSMGEVATEARAEWPLLHVAASGLVGSTVAGKQIDARRMGATLYSPSWHGWRIEASASRQADDAQCFSALPLNRDEVRISRGGRRSGAWFGFSTARGAWFDTLRVDQGSGSDTGRYRIPVGASRSLSGGVWRNIGSLLFSMSMGSRSQTAWNLSIIPSGPVRVDSLWSDSAGHYVPAPISPVSYDTRATRRQHRVLESELRMSWARGGFTLDVRSGANFLRSEGIRPQRWAAGAFSMALSPQVAVVGEVASQSASATQQLYSHRRGSLGLRFTTAPFSRPATTVDAPARASASAFRVQRVGPESVILGVRAPHARVVELTGDFVAWRAVRMERRSAEWWEVRVSMQPGQHRLNVRLDGANWIAPPGVPTLKDEFGGEVGVILVP